jgi:Spy/CpxP family protein refolding chaperone
MKATNRKNQVFMIMAVFVLLFAAAALAQGPGNGPGRGRGQGFGGEHRLEVLAEKLDLTAEQQESIGAIMEESRARGVELRKEMMRLQNELEGELLKDQPSEGTALGLVKEIGDLRTSIQSQRLESRLAVREQLTPEQRDRMLMMKERFGKDRGRRGGRKPGGRFGKSCSHECDGEGPHRGGRGAGED